MAGIAEFLAVPRLEPASTKVPLVSVALVGVPICEGPVVPMLYWRHHVMVGPAVDNPVGPVLAIEVDHVVANHVHRAVKTAELMIVERLDAFPAGTVTTVVDVLDEEGCQGVQVLAVHRHPVAVRELTDLVSRHELPRLQEFPPSSHLPGTLAAVVSTDMAVTFRPRNADAASRSTSWRSGRIRQRKPWYRPFAAHDASRTGQREVRQAGSAQAKANVGRHGVLERVRWPPLRNPIPARRDHR